MRKSHINWLYVSLFFALLATLTFRCSIPSDMLFSSSDVNIGGLSHRKNAGWDLFSGFFYARTLFGNANYNISFFNLLVQLIPIKYFLDFFYPIILIIGSLAMVWFLRLWSLGWLASILGALISFWFNSILLAASGHVYKMEVLVFSVIALALIEKIVRANSNKKIIGFCILTGLVVGLMMIEQQDVALLAGLFIGPYAIFRLVQTNLSWRKRICYLFMIGFVSFSFSGPILFQSYEKNIKNAASIQKDSIKKWDYVTQWSFVPAEWPDLISPGWSGWYTGHNKAPYWGVVGQSANYEQDGKGFKNFRLDSSYIGILPFLFAILGFLSMCKKRDTQQFGMGVFWLFACVIGLILSCGKYSSLYKLFYELPFFGDIRAPIKLLDNMQIGLGILAAFGINNICESKSLIHKYKKHIIITLSLIGLTFFLNALKVYIYPDIWNAKFEATGYSFYADNLIARVSISWLHASTCILIGMLAVLLIIKKQTVYALILIVLTLSLDSILLTSRYFKSTPINNITANNSVLDFLSQKQHNERIALIDQTGIYNSWLAVQGGYRDLNFFNIWQMNRMPLEYDNFLKVLGSNPFRMWQLASVRYIVIPEQLRLLFQKNLEINHFFKDRLKYQVPTSNGVRTDILSEFTGSIPRFALYYNWQSLNLNEHLDVLSSKDYDPLKITLADLSADIGSQLNNRSFDQINPTFLSKERVELNIYTKETCLLRFSQRFQPGWRCLVNGQEQTIIKLDYLVMGVLLDEGKHVVEFIAPKNKTYIYIISIGSLSLIISWYLFQRRLND